MLFLIDFENVNNSGMRGSSLLEKQDRVALFFSGCVKNMEARYLDAIEKSGCQFEIIRLINAGKNELDFYIASYLGHYFGEGHVDSAVIVSRDGGFSAVRDFWTKCRSDKRQVFLAPDIESGIQKLPQSAARSSLVSRMKNHVDIQTFYAGYQERLKLRRKVESLFPDAENQTQIEEIRRIIEKDSSPKLLYLDALKSFGRRQGLEVYRRLKQGNVS